MWDYSKKMMEHFINPRNVGEIKDPDAVGEVGNIVCGDALRLTLKVDPVNERIKDAKFQTFGCASAIATSSVLTELIKGKTVEEASKITNKDIVDFLGGLPREKVHCSVMGMEALEKALSDYRGNRSGEQPDLDRIVCQCFNVSEGKIKKVIRENSLRTVQEVTNYTKAGGGCGKCEPDIQKILDEYWAGHAPAEEKERPITNLERIELIKEQIDERIRPELRKDGGDLVLVDIKGKNVLVRFEGACLRCPVSGQTLKRFVQEELRRSVDREISVEEVK